ncbi:MAG TPA: head-tail adaptor protein [Gemmatimonadales bacterium]|nr:head-tail adaptor protein [Gemmatimonadales bacterium]
MAGAGDLRERLVIQENVWPAIAVAITRVGTTATATSSIAHDYVTGDYVTVAGATPSGYNGRFPVTVTGPTTFTYVVDGALVTPATGTVTTTFAMDAHGARRDRWSTKTTIRAQLLPKGANERLQQATVVSQVDLRFKVRRRGDITTAMRASWRPSWPGGQAQTLEIHGVLPFGDGRQWMALECGEVATV